MKEMLSSKFSSVASYLYSYIKPNNKQQDSLHKLIDQCCYVKENKNQIYTILSQIIKEQSSLEHKSKKVQQYPPKSIIILNGPIQVPFGKNSYAIIISIEIPQYFPNQKPQISIHNIDSRQFSVHPNYQRNRIRNDQYILQLSTLRQWSNTKSLKQLIEQSKMIMSRQFPFRKKNVSSIILQKTNPNIKRNQSFSNCLAFLDQTFSMVNKIDSHRQFQKIQRISLINQIVLSKIQSLKQQNNRLNQLIQQQQKQQYNSNLLNVIELDYKSKTLLNLIAEEQAYACDISFIQNKLFNKEINLETFIGLARKIEEEKYMLKIYINQMVKQIIE